MINPEINKIAYELLSLCVFRGIISKPQMKAFLSFLTCDGTDFEMLERYGNFVYTLAYYDYSFSEFLKQAVFEDENKYILGLAQGRELPQIITDNAVSELSLFCKLTEILPSDLFEQKEKYGYIPKFENEKTDFVKLYDERIKNISKYGYGIFASACMFRLDNDEIIPVKSADSISIDDFVGYDEERQKVLSNTLALVEGRPAANTLLFGDAGTGKSSTVKACANYYFSHGVRLIELRKDQLLSLSFVMDKIADSPLKFIIFIDDLSFNKNDDCFSMLKATLEGSTTAKSGNAVIYATSNRRHIVKEKFSDRSADDDIHKSDTVQELMSLSDRFGLTVYFSKPPKQQYLEIVHTLAKRNNIKNYEIDELDRMAEAFALARGSRSPRTAEHFIKSIL